MTTLLWDVTLLMFVNIVKDVTKTIDEYFKMVIC